MSVPLPLDSSPPVPPPTNAVDHDHMRDPEKPMVILQHKLETANRLAAFRLADF